MLILGVIFFAACAPKENTADGIGSGDLIILTDRQLTNFINILPELLKFSVKYNSGISREERDSTNADRKFFEALGNDSGIKKLLPGYNFSNSAELLQVYKNVVLEYTTITRDLTNYDTDLRELRMNIDSQKSNYAIGLSDKSLSESDRKVIQSMLNDLSNDELRISNIITVRKYEKKIDDVYLSFFGKK
jgi:hypothetical protein